MIEINHWLYVAEDYSVDSEKMTILIGVLRRVGEVLEKHYFNCFEIPLLRLGGFVFFSAKYL